MKKINVLICCFLSFSFNAHADFFQNIIAPNLQEKASFSFFGSEDLKKENSSTVPNQRNERGLDTNITLSKNETQRIYFKASAYQLDLGKDFVIGESSRSVKRRLMDTAAGLGLVQKNENGSRQSFSATFGTNGDRFLANERDSSLEALATYAMAPVDKGQFIFLLHYSNNRSYLNNVPLPMFVYVHRYSNNVILTAGIPFVALSVFELKNYTFNAFLAPGAHGIEGSMFISPRLQLLSGLIFKARAFKFSERTIDKDRLIVQDKKLSLGLKTELTKGTELAVIAGKSFDRYLHEGESLYKVKGEKLRQPNDTFLQTKLNLVF